MLLGDIIYTEISKRKGVFNLALHGYTQNINKYKRSLVFFLTFALLTTLCGCVPKDNQVINTTSPPATATNPITNPTNTPNLTALATVLTTLSPTPTQETMQIMYVKLNEYGSRVNVRQQPDTNAEIVAKLEHGASVRVLSLQNGWAKIELDGQYGYIRFDYLNAQQPQPLTPPPTSAPRGVHLKVYKERRILQLWSGSQMIGEYRIGLGFNPVGHKQQEGDGKTPEGEYYICVRNPNSSFYLSLGISYPGISDAQRGLEEGLISRREYNEIVNAINAGRRPPWNTALGGQIMVHGSGSGSDWTAGCIAVDNDVMDILWQYCSIGTKIYIYK